MSASEPSAVSSRVLQPRGRGAIPTFSEKTFYLEEFYGKSLLFALIPPSGKRIGELDSLVRTLRELKRNQTRSIVIASPGALARVVRRMGRRLAPKAAAPVFNPTKGRRSRPYPPDPAITEIWQALRSDLIAVASADTEDPAAFTAFAQELGSRLRVFKLILLDREGGLIDGDGGRISFLEMRRIPRALRRISSPVRRAILCAVRRALKDGVGSVNLTSPRQVYEELFSFLGTGTLFTERPYGTVRPVSIDDFDEVEALVARGQSEGFLLPRKEEEIARLLPSCFGYRAGDEHLAGICSLLTDPYRRERAGEITALYTLTRFQGEGVAAELINEVLREAGARRLRYVFACTTSERAGHFFERLKFRKAAPDEVASAKWRGYDPTRVARLNIFRADIT